MKKILSQLLPAFTNTVVAADMTKIDDLSEINNIPVSNLVFDSREVKQDSLFFALPGTHTDGNKYIAQAILAGANAVVFQGELTPSQKKDVAEAIMKRTLLNALSDITSTLVPLSIFPIDS